MGRWCSHTSESRRQGRTRVLGGDKRLAPDTRSCRKYRLSFRSDGVLRHVSYSIEGLKSFAVVAAETASGAESNDPRSPRVVAGSTSMARPGRSLASPFSRVVDGHVKRGFFSRQNRRCRRLCGIPSGSARDSRLRERTDVRARGRSQTRSQPCSATFRFGAPRKGSTFALILLCAFVVPRRESSSPADIRACGRGRRCPGTRYRHSACL